MHAVDVIFSSLSLSFCLLLLSLFNAVRRSSSSLCGTFFSVKKFVSFFFSFFFFSFLWTRKDHTHKKKKNTQHSLSRFCSRGHARRCRSLPLCVGGGGVVVVVSLALVRVVDASSLSSSLSLSRERARTKKERRRRRFQRALLHFFFREDREREREAFRL